MGEFHDTLRAFPNTGNKGIKPEPGMTLRDWFAGQALTAIIGSSPSEAVRDICSGVRGGQPMAYGAYALADAMLAARGTAPAAELQMQHVGYYDEDGFDWMTGIKPRHCELYAARTQEHVPC